MAKHTAVYRLHLPIVDRADDRAIELRPITILARPGNTEAQAEVKVGRIAIIEERVFVEIADDCLWTPRYIRSHEHASDAFLKEHPMYQEANGADTILYPFKDTGRQVLKALAVFGRITRQQARMSANNLVFMNAEFCKANKKEEVRAEFLRLFDTGDMTPAQIRALLRLWEKEQTANAIAREEQEDFAAHVSTPLDWE